MENLPNKKLKSPKIIIISLTPIPLRGLLCNYYKNPSENPLLNPISPVRGWLLSPVAQCGLDGLGALSNRCFCTCPTEASADAPQKLLRTPTLGLKEAAQTGPIGGCPHWA